MPLTLNLLPWIAGGTTILVGLVCDAVLLARFTPAPAMRIQRKAWGLRELLQAAAAIVGLFLLSSAAYELVAHATHKDIEALAPVIIPVEMVLRIAALFGFALFFKHRGVPLASSFGIDSVPTRTALAAGVVFGLASLPPVGAVMLAGDGFCRLIGLQPSEQPIAELFLTTDSGLVLGTLTVFAMVVAPVFEEFFFRGFAYPALKERLGSVRALVIVSLAFAASHLHGPSFVPLFVLALGLGLAYELTGTLLTPITMHAVFNSTMIVQLFYQRAHP
jgi:membrane protease YdiL (CAAX protease family)